MHNKITFVTNQQGERIETHEEMEKEFTGYFKEILKEPEGNRTEATELSLNIFQKSSMRSITISYSSQLL